MAFKEPVPERFGAVGGGLMFSCRNCGRGTAFERAELIKRWGEEGKVAEIAQRFRCTNCRRRGASVDVIRVRIYTTEGERVRGKMGPVDRLAFDIRALKTTGTVK